MSELGIFYPTIPEGGGALIATITGRPSGRQVDYTDEELTEAYTSGKVVRGVIPASDETGLGQWFEYTPDSGFMNILYDMNIVVSDNQIEITYTQIKWNKNTQKWENVYGTVDLETV